MRKLLNTLYITNEEYYLARDGENIIIKEDGKTFEDSQYIYLKVSYVLITSEQVLVL